MSQQSMFSDFRRLYMDNRQRLVAYAQRFVGDNADDIVHDSFIKFWESYGNRDDEQARKLLFTIVRNKCLDHLKHRNIITGDGLVPAESPEGEELLYNFDYFCPSAETDVLYADLVRQVNSIVSSLPERCREVFILKRGENLKNSEIAERLGISQKTVEKHLHKAFTAFRSAIGEGSSTVFKIFVLFLFSSLNS